MWRFNLDRLIALREARGLSGEAFAAMIGTSKQHVSQWETGELTPTTATIIKISNIFDVSPLYFFTKKGAVNE
jgi:transcriptional regulator with XRE-family HTH domain